MIVEQLPEAAQKYLPAATANIRSVSKLTPGQAMDAVLLTLTVLAGNGTDGYVVWPGTRDDGDPAELMDAPRAFALNFPVGPGVIRGLLRRGPLGIGGYRDMPRRFERSVAEVVARRIGVESRYLIGSDDFRRWGDVFGVVQGAMHAVASENKRRPRGQANQAA